MKVALFTLGGTIASTGPAAAAGAGAGTVAGAGSQAEGVAPRLTGADLLASVPGLEQTGAELVTHDFRQVPSSSLTIDDILDLAAAIRDQTSPGATGAGGAGGADGVVVSQGTDTIEETSFLLDLVYDGDPPIVFTGAMRNPTLAGADGPANLLAAVTVAAAPQARGLGGLVVLGDEIHAARYVRKAHTTSVAAFVSPPAGPLGFVAEGRFVLLTRPAHRPALPALRNLPAAPGRPGRAVRTGLVTMVLGDDGALLEAAAGRLDGLVVAGYGAGHVPAAVVGRLDALARRIPVVLASRTGAGMVLARTYGYPGSERDLRDRGLIGAGFLDPLKARLLLHLLLAAGATRDEIAAGFATVGADSAAPRQATPADGRYTQRS